jgi:hypothetical protein
VSWNTGTVVSFIPEGGKPIVVANKLQRAIAGLLFFGALACCQGAQGAPLWYNGNRDNRDFLTNQTSSLSPGGIDQRIYDNFVVPAGHTWYISGVFSNDFANPLVSFSQATASWEIRSGVSAGNGGTLVASGDGKDTLTSTGRTSAILSFTAHEFTNEVDGLLGLVILTPGTYWLSVAPDTDGSVDSFWYIGTTSGTAAIGTPPGNDGNSFESSLFFGDSFAPTTNLEGPGTWDYSMGVVGTSVAVVVPEPSEVAMLFGASLSMAVYGFATYARRRAAMVNVA